MIINTCIVIGRLTRSVNAGRTKQNQPVLTTSLAIPGQEFPVTVIAYGNEALTLSQATFDDEVVITGLLSHNPQTQQVRIKAQAVRICASTPQKTGGAA
jgi:hypothetical protein